MTPEYVTAYFPFHCAIELIHACVRLILYTTQIHCDLHYKEWSNQTDSFSIKEHYYKPNTVLYNKANDEFLTVR